MQSITRAAQAQVQPLRCLQSFVTFLIDGCQVGVYMRLGFSPCRWKRTCISTRLGRRFRRLVYLQVC
jgi:hypothetical protein